MKNNYLTTAWLVLLLAVLFGASLAAVQIALKPRIDANKMAETYNQIPALVPGGDVTGDMENFGGVKAYRVKNDSGQTAGWVVPASGQGFAGKIEILLGLNSDATEITGIYVLGQQETPGLGNNIVRESWRKQFSQVPTTPALQVTKEKARKDYQIEAITGATISSQSVVDIVNNVVGKIRKSLEGGQA